MEWCGGVRDMGFCLFFFKAEEGIRYLVRYRGLGDVYKRQIYYMAQSRFIRCDLPLNSKHCFCQRSVKCIVSNICLLYTSDAADERSSVDLGGRRIIQKKTHLHPHLLCDISTT